jgi:hypothetical protein
VGFVAVGDFGNVAETGLMTVSQQRFDETLLCQTQAVP